MALTQAAEAAWSRAGADVASHLPRQMAGRFAATSTAPSAPKPSRSAFRRMMSTKGEGEAAETAPNPAGTSQPGDQAKVVCN